MTRSELERIFDQVAVNGLPGDKAHKDVLPVNRVLSSQLLNLDDYRESAVGILLYEGERNLKSILIERPEYLGAHSSQIAFPGGKKDETDPDLEFTARRECFEEIAIQPAAPYLIGKLSLVHIPISKFTVHPFVFYLESLPELIPDPREVANIMHFDVSDLVVENAIQYTDIRVSDQLVRKNIPYFSINGHVVWGATAMMLAELRYLLRSY